MAPVPASAVAPGNPPAAAPVNGEGSSADGMYFNPSVTADTGTLVRAAGKPKRKFNWMRALLMALSVGFAVCVVILAIAGVLWFFFGSTWLGLSGPSADVKGNLYYGQIRGQTDGNEKVYKLALLRGEWEIDRDVLSRFEAHAAWKHREYDFWFAVFVQDFASFKPRDAEMLRIGIDKLENYYGEALEMGKKAEPAKVGDLPAQKIEFKGQVKATNWRGECYMFFNNGIAYWLYIASPDWSTVEYFADELPKKNFFIETERKGWREQPPPMETFVSVNTKINVTMPKGVWEKHDAKTDDKNGELLLFGKYQKMKDNRKNAHFFVFTFEKKDDLKEALKAARDYVTSHLNDDKENMNFKLVHANDVAEGQSDTGAAEDIGNRRGRLIDLKKLLLDEPKRYYLLAVVNEPDMGYAILCDCTWESRQIWRQDFIDVMRGMNFKKGE